MAEVNFDALDLNLLRVFDALFVEGNTTRAGERLHLSQSAISHALGRLRHILKDELFIRSASGMTPTALSLEIGPTIHELLSELRSALTTPSFEPAISERVFSIACGDYLAAVLLPRLLVKVRDVAPRIHFRLVPIHPSNVDDLADGKLDMIVADFGHVPEQFDSEFLMDDKIVCVMGKGRHQAHTPLSLSQLATMPLVVPSYGTREADDCAGETLTTWRNLEIKGGWHLALLSALEQERDIRDAPAPRRVTLISILAALEIVSNTDYVAVLPSRLAADKAERFRLETFELPNNPSRSLALQMLSHRSHGAQPAVLWLREMLRQTAHDLAHPQPASTARNHDRLKLMSAE